MILNVLILAAGLAALVFSADHFVLGSARIAGALKLPRVVIGAVVIGFGTSLPEMVVSIVAAAGGDRDLGVGNIVGSNVANLGLVLAVAGLITTMTISSSTLRREIPLSLAATALFALFYVDGRVDRWEGVILIVALVGAVLFLLRYGGADEIEEIVGTFPLGTESLRTVGGLIGVVVGAQLAVNGASSIADDAGISGGFVGFSVVALGTSLPELVTTFAGARRGETALIIGNLFGSNVFNSLAVGGGIGLVGPGLVGDDRLTGYGILMMLVVCTLASGLGARDNQLRLPDGLILLTMYVVSLVVLGVGAGEDDDDDIDDTLAGREVVTVVRRIG